jgi:hypothetical protein
MFQISEVQEAPAFNGRRSFLTLRAAAFVSLYPYDFGDKSHAEYLPSLSMILV